MAAIETYPEDLKYHAEHDWARIEGDEAVLGITWFAQDSLGELVHYEAPKEGDSVAKDSPYGEIESVKAVSDVIAPLSGEVIEVNQKVVDEPETGVLTSFGLGRDKYLQILRHVRIAGEVDHLTATPPLERRFV